jgi:small multidrug resistance family-3 protein
VREHAGLSWTGAGVIALGVNGFVVTPRPDPHFGRILATYGGILIAGSLAWGVIGATIRPRVAVIRYALSGA